MKQLLSFLLFCMLVSCQQEEQWEESKGILQLEVTQVGAEVEKLSRAVSEGLIVEIWKEGGVYTDGARTYRFESGAFPKALSLPVGNYTVKAFSRAYEDAKDWTEVQLGDPIYYVENPIAIVADKVNSINLSVPMLNVGISFALPEQLSNFIDSYVFTLTQNDFQGGHTRVVRLREGQVVYVDAKAFAYQLEVKNVDGESKTLDLTQENVVPGTIYHIAYHLGGNHELSGASIH